MSRLLVAGLVAVLASPASAQRRSTPQAAPAAALPAAPVKVAPSMICPTVLGVGVNTRASFCDVMSSRDPAEGIIIKLPSHEGSVTLAFDLHNRHIYSDEEVKARRAYRRYTATIGVLTMDNTLISRAVVQNEFRTAADLVDRFLGGGAGRAGLKAVAPTGTESISITIPEGEEQVSVLGEKLRIERLEETATYTQPGRPIAYISHVMIEYTPEPPSKGAGRTPTSAANKRRR